MSSSHSRNRRVKVEDSSKADGKPGSIESLSSSSRKRKFNADISVSVVRIFCSPKIYSFVCLKLSVI
jgi:hypothetical protein